MTTTVWIYAKENAHRNMKNKSVSECGTSEPVADAQEGVERECKTPFRI